MESTTWPGVTRKEHGQSGQSLTDLELGRRPELSRNDNVRRKNWQIRCKYL